MAQIIVHGGNNRLTGTVQIEGAKNAVLPILAAGILAEEGKMKLTNIPILSDVFSMNQVIRHLNAQVDFNQDENLVEIDATTKLGYDAPYEYVSKMRASTVVMGPLLARCGRARVSMPGGCSIGKRPIDLHLKGFEALGAKITQKAGYIEAYAEQLTGAKIYLDFPSVGATQNIMMAAVKAKGTTILENVAREPEIIDLANVLNKMGANIKGAGTETMQIVGVDKMHGCEHAIVQDRIEAGTFMVASAVTGGDIEILDAIVEHNRPLISKLQEMGVQFIQKENSLRVIGPERMSATSVKTLPHPGFPTDMQAQMTIAQAIARGRSTMCETIFESRFQHLDELRRMNLDFEVEGNTAVIHGGKKLQGAIVKSTDLRAAAALIIAGLVANGDTVVTQLHHLDRGYYKFHEKLQSLGAKIERVEVDEAVKVMN